MFKQSLSDTKKFVSKPFSQPSFNRWRSVYDFELSILYSNLKDIINVRYDNNVNWDDEDNYTKFCKFIYNCSSRYIPKFYRFRNEMLI